MSKFFQLPDNVGERHDTKTTYQVEIRLDYFFYSYQLNV